MKTDEFLFKSTDREPTMKLMAQATDSRLSIPSSRTSIRWSVSQTLWLKLPIHDLDRFNRVLAAWLGLRANQIENRTHALTGSANATVAGLMNGDEILILSVRGLNEEVKQRVTGRKTVFCFRFRVYLTYLHVLIVFRRQNLPEGFIPAWQTGYNGS